VKTTLIYLAVGSALIYAFIALDADIRRREHRAYIADCINNGNAPAVCRNRLKAILEAP